MELPDSKETIVALSSAPGIGAIALIRLSGEGVKDIIEKIFKPNSGVLKFKTKTATFGKLYDQDSLLDEVVMTYFQGPGSYTGQDIAEISCHGSGFIQQQVLQICIREGARMAKPGEFTLRAFLNRKLDLSQAEAVADLISSTSSTAHQVAMQQMRGGFSSKIKVLRENLVNFASLLELELDFSEEDVEFANRGDLKSLILSIHKVVQQLIDSFEVGNVIKNGIPVVIVGKPNAGKSTLLNNLLSEDRAIVSEIPGTTRDTIEDEVVLDGVLFRFIDTAGIRETYDTIESLGVSRTFEKIKQSAVVMYMFDVRETTPGSLRKTIDEVSDHIKEAELLLLGNKIDGLNLEELKSEFSEFKNILFISARENLQIEYLKNYLVDLFDKRALNVPETVVTNVRHVEALRRASNALENTHEGLARELGTELLAMDIRMALTALGEITGDITTDDLLENIFSKFCIGK